MRPVREKWYTHLDITTVCHSDCIYCSRYMRHTPKEGRWHMPLDYIEKALDSLQDWPNRIGLMGGEPTLHPQFEEICAMLRDPKRAHKNYPNTMDRFTLFTAGGPRYEKFKNMITGTFRHTAVFEHSPEQAAICKHQPATIAIDDVIDDVELKKSLIDDCWVDRTWCATITMKGGFFCEVAAAIDRVTNGPGGLELTKDWWNITPDDPQHKKQVADYCGLCGMPIPIERETLSSGRERISEGLFNILKSCGSPGVTEDKCTLFKKKLTKEDIERGRIGWKPGLFRQDLRPDAEC